MIDMKITSSRIARVRASARRKKIAELEVQSANDFGIKALPSSGNDGSGPAASSSASDAYDLENNQPKQRTEHDKAQSKTRGVGYPNKGESGKSLGKGSPKSNTKSTLQSELDKATKELAYLTSRMEELKATPKPSLKRGSVSARIAAIDRALSKSAAEIVPGESLSDHANKILPSYSPAASDPAETKADKVTRVLGKPPFQKLTPSQAELGLRTEKKLNKFVSTLSGIINNLEAHLTSLSARKSLNEFTKVKYAMETALKTVNAWIESTKRKEAKVSNSPSRAKTVRKLHKEVKRARRVLRAARVLLSE